MTTIVYRDGVMAGDTSSVYSGAVVIQNMSKVIRHETPERILLGGCAGVSALCAQFRQWIVDGAMGYPNMGDPEASEIQAMLAVLDKGSGKVRIWLYETDGAYQINDEFIALGSGSIVALGALYVGADPSLAVEAAIRIDVNSNGWIDEVSFASRRAKRTRLRRVRLGNVGNVGKHAKKAKNDK